MGITRDARFAAVTNYRDPSEKRSTARSRGGLVTDFLLGTDSPARFLTNLAARAHEYNGFNLILGDGTSLFYYGSREGEPRAIEPGVHGLSNHLLDEPWPKVVRGRARMEAALAASEPGASLFQMLSDRARRRAPRDWRRHRLGAPPGERPHPRRRLRNPGVDGAERRRIRGGLHGGAHDRRPRSGRACRPATLQPPARHSPTSGRVMSLQVCLQARA